MIIYLLFHQYLYNKKENRESCFYIPVKHNGVRAPHRHYAYRQALGDRFNTLSCHYTTIRPTLSKARTGRLGGRTEVSQYCRVQWPLSYSLCSLACRGVTLAQLASQVSASDRLAYGRQGLVHGVCPHVTAVVQGLEQLQHLQGVGDIMVELVRPVVLSDVIELRISEIAPNTE